ncbi:hypothetical protein B0H16DRAFT_1034248, partial [Mycena metata]
RFHVLGNVLRVIIAVVLSPFSLLSEHGPEEADDHVRPGWLVNFAVLPDSVLSTAKGGGSGQYEVTGLSPTWVVEATIERGRLKTSRQIAFSKMIADVGYTALSYPMESAIVLAKKQGFVPEAPKAGLPLPRPDQRLISDYLLELYCSATGPNGNPNRIEYIWLDERCLSDDAQQDNEETSKTQRSIELGKLADIFRGATQVAVFCHEENCDHTTLQCTWGQRLFTLPEILHAEKVLRLTRSVQRDGMTAKFVDMEGYKFREAMQTNAAKHNKWHSFAMFQHFVNAGSIPWQQAIHALIVEAIRRDEAGISTTTSISGKF